MTPEFLAVTGQLAFVVALPCFLGLLGTIFWLWMIIDCASNEPSGRSEKIAWIIVILSLPLLGSLLYFVVRRPRRIAETGR